jgi:hypothetical protein
MIEAVVVLPVLLLLLFCVGFTRERYLGRQRAALSARACAWAHAIAGCGATPPACTTAVEAAPADDPDSLAIIDGARAAASARAIDVFDGIPVLGDAVRGLFGTYTGARALSATPLPWDRARQVVDRSELVLLCNERPRDVLAAAQNVFCTHVPRVPCAEASP